MESKVVFKIIDNITGEFAGSYTRGNYDKYEFDSYYSAENANCHGMFKNKEKYTIKKYKVTYSIIKESEKDVD